MQPQFVDLHVHTTASDGSDTPARVVDLAAASHIRSIAITDHDTLAGLAEAEQEGQQKGVEIIRGCELSTSSEYGEIHILGLWIPRTAPELERTLEKLRTRRNERNERILERLAALSMPLDMAEVHAFSGGESIGRPHIARAMVARGYAHDVQTAMTSYLATNRPAYVPKAVFLPEEAASLLKAAGATVAVAHLMLLRCPEDWRAALVARLVEAGIDAIEAYHSEYSARDERMCVEFARRFNLGLTGGSDYHGIAKPRIRIGRGKGGLRVTQAMLERLKARRLEQGLPV